MRYLLLIIGFAVLFLANHQTSANTTLHYQAVSDQLIKNAERSVAEKNNEKAILFYNQAMVANPKNINSYKGLASIYNDIGQYALAIKYYDIALSIDPVDLAALGGSVMTNLKRGDFTAAEESFKTMQQVCEIIECEQLTSVSQAIEAHKSDEDAK